jgi:hypothetical protein
MANKRGRKSKEQSKLDNPKAYTTSSTMHKAKPNKKPKNTTQDRKLKR